MLHHHILERVTNVASFPLSRTSDALALSKAMRAHGLREPSRVSWCVRRMIHRSSWILCTRRSTPLCRCVSLIRRIIGSMMADITRPIRWRGGRSCRRQQNFSLVRSQYPERILVGSSELGKREKMLPAQYVAKWGLCSFGVCVGGVLGIMLRRNGETASRAGVFLSYSQLILYMSKPALKVWILRFVCFVKGHGRGWAC